MKILFLGSAWLGGALLFAWAFGHFVGKGLVNGDKEEENKQVKVNGR